MGTPHKHRDAIISWANGEEIQREHKGGWIDIKDPLWDRSINYRVKPKRVKKEGWVNVYKATQPNHIGIAHVSNAYKTKEVALEDKRMDIEPTDTILITWEEEV